MNSIGASPKNFEFFDRVPLGLCVIDRNFYILFWNETLEQWTKINRNCIVGKKLHEEFPHLNQEQYLERLRFVLSGGPPAVFSAQLHQYFIPCLTKNHKYRRQHVVVKGHWEENIPYAVISIQDVTELNSHICNLRSLSKQKSELLAVSSHDLKSPLSVIIGFAQLMQLDDNLTPDQQESLNYMLDAGTLLNAIIEDLLEIGMLQSEKRQIKINPVDIIKIAESICIMAKSQADRKNIIIKNEYDADASLHVLADIVALRRIFNNIVTNALKFTPKGGYIIIGISENPSNKDKVRITITDNGVGMSQDKVANLFKQKINKSTVGTSGEKGTGLGMAITRDLITRQKGTISVVSKEGVGTTFNVELPKANI